LARQGQIRGTAGVLGITEQGVRNRLLALEGQLGVELYRKRRAAAGCRAHRSGPAVSPARARLSERARELCQAVDLTGNCEVHVAASQHLTLRLIDVPSALRRAVPEIQVRVST
jgi:LysR family cys regulon transcriptional activator